MKNKEITVTMALPAMFVTCDGMSYAFSEAVKSSLEMDIEDYRDAPEVVSRTNNIGRVLREYLNKLAKVAAEFVGDLGPQEEVSEFNHAVIEGVYQLIEEYNANVRELNLFDVDEDEKNNLDMLLDSYNIKRDKQ